MSFGVILYDIYFYFEVKYIEFDELNFKIRHSHVSIKIEMLLLSTIAKIVLLSFTYSIELQTGRKINLT